MGVEQFAPLHDRGSSHGDSRIVRKAYFEHPDYVPLLRRAYDGWAGLEQACGRQLITSTGALMIGRPQSRVVAGTLESARRWQLDHDFLDAEAMADRFGQFRLGADEAAVFERDAGVVDPQGSGQGAPRAGACGRRRAPLSCRFDGWDVGRDGVTARVDGEVVTASHLVIAAGPWAGTLLGGAFPLTPVRTVTYHFEPVGDRAPFAPDRFPAFVWELAPETRSTGSPTSAAGRRRSGSITDTWRRIRITSTATSTPRRWRRCVPCSPHGSRRWPVAASPAPCACTR